MLKPYRKVGPQSNILDKTSDVAAQFLRTFVLIVSVHPYCARTFTRHVMHENAR